MTPHRTRTTLAGSPLAFPRRPLVAVLVLAGVSLSNAAFAADTPPNDPTQPTTQHTSSGSSPIVVRPT